MIDKEYALYWIEAVLKRLGAKYAKPEAVMLTHRTGLAETGYSTTRQYGGGPARSYWQVEPSTAVDLLGRYLIKGDKCELRAAVEAVLERDVEDLARSVLLPDILSERTEAGIILCRVRYLPVMSAIPKDLAGQAIYWKEHYNTPQGAGTVEHFIEAVEGYEGV